MRFYFNFISHDKDEILDFEGVELEDWLAAHRHAVRIVKQTVPFIPDDWRGWRIQVTDESRRNVLSVLFHAPSRYAAPRLSQSCLRTNVPNLSALFDAETGRLHSAAGGPARLRSGGPRPRPDETSAKC